MNNSSLIRTAEIFAGAGLLSEGFRRAGFSSIFAAEADERAVKTFNMNIADVAVQWDVRNVCNEVKCEVIVAGPPCQGFSTLGKRQDHDERNRLSLTVVDWVLSSGASVAVIENVPQFLRSSYWETIKKRLKKHGFESTEWVLNAADFGAPQNRTRAFAVLSKIGLPKAPVRSVQHHKTVRDAFAGLSTSTGSDGMHVSPAPSEIAASRFVLIPTRGDKRDIMSKAPDLCPPSWFKIAGEATDVWGRMDYDKPANTIRCSFQNASKGRYIHPTANRVISLREGARLQGVPDHWQFHGDRTSIARQIGNGVPIPLAEAVAKSIASLFH
jgi:DNA (cytosine-5)-methyltransferase 1